MRSLRPDEAQAVVEYLRREPAGPTIRKIATDVSWWEIQLGGIEDFGSLRTLWHKKTYELTKPADASAPTIAQIAQQIRNRSFQRPGLQAKVTRHLNRPGSGHLDFKIVLEQRPWGTFIVEGTTRAVALYLLNLQGQNLADLFPVKAAMFSFPKEGSK